MNLIEESFQSKEEKKKSRATKIILAAIILVVIIIIAIISYMMYIKSTIMTLTLNGQVNEKVKNLLVFENDGTIYAPIKEIAPYFGYDSFNGEYSEKSEQQSKCYIQSQNEVVNFELGQNIIYKLDLSQRNANYEYVDIKKPIKAINGVLYISTEGLQEAFNLSFQYEQAENRITIFTMPYLYKYYASKVLDYGYSKLDNTFVNQKAILNDKLIVQRSNNQYGVIGVDGTVILEAKYDYITYLLNTGDFLVQNNKKVGIMSSNRETKVPIMYDDIDVMDKDSELYAVKQDNKYGMIDTRGNTKIYTENDAIGIDISKFSRNNIKNRYILADSLIPIKRDGLWALYDKNGNQLTEYKYDSFGYIASNNKDAINLLVIPDYNVLVACKDKKYTLINSSGKELFGTIADDIYIEISGEEKHYYIGINDQKIDAEEWMDLNGISAKSETTKQRNNTENSNRNSNEENENENNYQNNEEEQQNDNNGEQQEEEQQEQGDEQQEEQGDEQEEEQQDEQQEE